MSTYDLKSATVVTGGLEADAVVIGAAGGQSDANPQPILASAVAGAGTLTGAVTKSAGSPLTAIGPVLQTALDAKVAGPAVAVDTNVAVYSGTTGKVVQDGGFSILGIINTTIAAIFGSVKNSIQIDVGAFQLVGDTAAPGNNKVYGTDSGGARGWKDDPAGMAHVESPPYNAIGDGVVDDTAAFQMAAADGVVVKLRAGATYLVSEGFSMTTGASWAGFVCSDGWATIMCKTGVGGFNITDVSSGNRHDITQCVISCDDVDGTIVRNVHFTTDQATEVIIHPIRISDGMGTLGFDFDVSFANFAVGTLVGINSAGSGALRQAIVRSAKDCGATEGNTYWTGIPQTTVVEIDNDIIASTPSQPCYIEIHQIRDILFSGDALTDFGQQTDGFTVVGQGANSHSGSEVHIGEVDGIGEVVDLHGWRCNVRIGSVKNCYLDAVKCIHGAQHNNIELGVIENSGRSVVGIFGSDSSPVERDTANNTVRVGTVKNPGTFGLGLSGETTIALFANSTLTFKPINNTVEIDNVLGNGVDLDYVVRDGGSDQSNANSVIVHQASGWALRSVLAPPGNVRVHYMGRGYTEMALSASQTGIATATETKVAFAEVLTDVEGIATAGSNMITPEWPGLYRVEGQIRADAWDTGVLITLGLKRDAVLVAATETLHTSGAKALTPKLDTTLYIGEDEAGTAACDLTLHVTHDAGANRTITDANTQTFFKVTRLG